MHSLYYHLSSYAPFVLPFIVIAHMYTACILLSCFPMHSKSDYIPFFCLALYYGIIFALYIQLWHLRTGWFWCTLSMYWIAMHLKLRPEHLYDNGQRRKLLILVQKLLLLLDTLAGYRLLATIAGRYWQIQPIDDWHHLQSGFPHFPRFLFPCFWYTTYHSWFWSNPKADVEITYCDIWRQNVTGCIWKYWKKSMAFNAITFSLSFRTQPYSKSQKR